MKPQIRENDKPVYIMGIQPGHDATVAIIDGEGHILSATAEERLSRIKYHQGFPFRSIEECLRLAGLERDDLSAIGLGFQKFVYPDTPEYNEFYTKRKGSDYDLANENLPLDRTQAIKNLLTKNLRLARGTNESLEDHANRSIEFTRKTYRALLDELGFENIPFYTQDHHASHAASAYYTSGFDPEKALIVTLDGAGDGLCASVSIVEEGRLKRISGASSAISPGTYYSAITSHCGFKRLRHEGKITGLAAYGNPDLLFDFAQECIDYDPESEQFIHHLSGPHPLKRKVDTLVRVLRNDAIEGEYASLLRHNFKEKFPSHKMENLAAAAQAILEHCSVEYVKPFQKATGKTQVALAGGVFANVRVNQKVLEIPEVETVFIHPNMGDGGVAAGAAYLTLQELTGTSLEPREINDVYYGPGYADDEIKAAIDRFSLEAEYHKDIELEIAKLIADKKVVGRFNGRMEYGPRALGNRSILADPTDPSINDWLNERLKRTEFMPFAPAALESEAPTIFKNFQAGAYPATFMTITFDVEKSWADRARGVVHVDDTARPQVINEGNNPSYFRILEEYYKLTGLPLFVNTSFNMHEEPIVCTPDDALRSFLNRSVDHLAIGSFLLNRKD